jgi:hypothetical protein
MTVDGRQPMSTRFRHLLRLPLHAPQLRTPNPGLKIGCSASIKVLITISGQTSLGSPLL